MVADRPTLGDAADDPPHSIEIHHHIHSSSTSFAEHSPVLPDIPTPDAYRAAVDTQYRKHAIEQGCARVRESKRTLSPPAILRIESGDPYRHLVGLDHRLKGEDRLSEKVASAMVEQPDLTYAEAFAMVKDSIRFTLEYPMDRCADGVRADHERLESEGFELVDRRNTWAMRYSAGNGAGACKIPR